MSTTRPYRNIAGDHLGHNLHNAQGQRLAAGLAGLLTKLAAQGDGLKKGDMIHADFGPPGGNGVCFA